MPHTIRPAALTAPSHEDRALHLLRERGALTRGELAELLGVSRTTMSGVAATLLARRAVVVTETDAAGRQGSGRPAERLALDPRAGQFLGVEFTHNRVVIVLADASHDVVGRGSARYDSPDWDVRIHTAFTLIDSVLADADLHLGDLQAIAIGVPGPVSLLGVELRSGWGRRPEGEEIRRRFQDHFGAPVLIDNNLRFAAIAEATWAPGDGTDIIYARLGAGVGGGVIVAGRLVTGSAGLAGEVGHVRVVDDGKSCRCGKSGCLETIAALPAILATCRERGVDVHDLAELTSAIERHDSVVDEVLREAGAAVGHALAGPATALNPEQIIIGGDVVAASPTLLRSIANTLRYELFPVVDMTPTVRAARGGEDVGALGAVYALFRQSPMLVGYRAEPAPPSPMRVSA